MHPALLVIAQFGRTDPATLRLEQKLSSLNINKSLGLALLKSALERRFQRKFQWISPTLSIQEVLDRIDETRGAEGAQEIYQGARNAEVMRDITAAQVNAPRMGGVALGHGIDIQLVTSLPETSGEWELNPFYASHFSPEEMEAARAKPDIRAHLAGLWCAKEAVKKSDPELMALEFAGIAILQDSAGRPSAYLADGRIRDRFGIIVSISHSSSFAFASAIIWRQ